MSEDFYSSGDDYTANPCLEDCEIAIYQDLLEEARDANHGPQGLLKRMDKRQKEGTITDEQRQYILAVLTHSQHTT